MFVLGAGCFYVFSNIKIFHHFSKKFFCRFYHISLLQVLILSGINQFQAQIMYWKEQEETCNKLIRENIQRNTFDKFMQYIHVFDPTNQRAQKLVWEYFSELQETFSPNCVCRKERDICEYMIEYIGKYSSSLKQPIHLKHFQFG